MAKAIKKGIVKVKRAAKISVQTSDSRKPKQKQSGTNTPIQAPRGMRDILPQEQKYWEYVIETAKLVIRGWDFQRVDTPIIEETILFNRAVGEDSDIVSKEMFELKARGGRFSLQFAARGYSHYRTLLY